MSLYFLTFHDEAGTRIDDDADYPLTETQLDAYLAGCDATAFVSSCGAPLVRDPNGALVAYQTVAE